jgi:hypothetical protein
MSAALLAAFFQHTKNSPHTPSHMRYFLKTSGLAVLLAAAANISAFAAVEVPNLNGILSIDGYVTAAAGIDKNNGEQRDYQLFNSQNRGKDSIKLGLRAEYQGFHAYADALYQPNTTERNGGGDEAGILEAYAGYQWQSSSSEHKLKIQAGKFITYLGYESFHTIGNAFITGGHWASNFGGVHSGIRADYANSTFSVGGALVDSVGNGRGFYEGDGDLHNLGIEAFVKFTGIDRFTIFAGIAYDSKNDEFFAGDLREILPEWGRYADFAKKQFVFDLWASYKFNDNFNVGAEFLAEDAKFVSAKFTWIAFAQLVSTGRILRNAGFNTDQASLSFRFSGAKRHDLSQYKFSVAPAYVFNEHLSIRLEASYILGDDVDFDQIWDSRRNIFWNPNSNSYDRWYIGAQAVLKF